MTCPNCNQDTLSVTTEYNFMGYEVGDRLECSKCAYSKFYPYDPNRILPDENGEVP